MAITLNLATRDRVTINGIEYIVGELPWRPAEHRAVLERRYAGDSRWSGPSPLDNPDRCDRMTI